MDNLTLIKIIFMAQGRDFYMQLLEDGALLLSSDKKYYTREEKHFMREHGCIYDYREPDRIVIPAECLTPFPSPSKH